MRSFKINYSLENLQNLNNKLQFQKPLKFINIISASILLVKLIVRYIFS